MALANLVFLLSCVRSNPGDIPRGEKTEDETIPLSDAIDNLTETVKALSFHTITKSVPLYNSSDAIVLGKQNLGLATKSGECLEIPDTLFYIVNFNNDEGFAVLAGSTKIPMPVLCITESGNLQVQDFEDAIVQMQAKTKAENASFSDMGQSFVPALILSSVFSSLDERNDGGNRDGEGGEGGEGGQGGEGNDIDYDSDYPFMVELPEQGGVNMPEPLGPYVISKWDQSIDPFNRYTPNNYPAGCSAIALGQLVLANRYSNTMVFNGVTCDWDEMEGVYNYLNFGSMQNHGSTEGFEQVANFVYGLGHDYLDLDYGETTHNSNPQHGQYFVNAMTQLGYTASLEYNQNSFSNTLKMKTYDMLREGYPVLTRGRRSDNSSGHDWLIDGYRYVVSLSYSGHFFHINWGWGGFRDGYYHLGVFDTGNGTFCDPIYDNQYYFQNGNAYNYSFKYSIVDYSIE